MSNSTTPLCQVVVAGLDMLAGKPFPAQRFTDEIIVDALHAMQQHVQEVIDRFPDDITGEGKDIHEWEDTVSGWLQLLQDLWATFVTTHAYIRHNSKGPSDCNMDILVAAGKLLAAHQKYSELMRAHPHVLQNPTSTLLANWRAQLMPHFPAQALPWWLDGSLEPWLFMP